MKFSVIIPARNEEAYLPSCLDALVEAFKPISAPCEIIVVLNRCTDLTEKIAIERGCRIVHEDAKNLSKIRNAGVRAAVGEIIVTVDADSKVSSNMFTSISKKISFNKCIGGGVLILPERWSLGIICSGVLLAPIALWHGIQGGLFFLERETFDSIGGFNEELHSAEDIDFAIRLKRYGKRQGKSFAKLYLSYLVTSCRKFDRLGDWYFIKNFWETVSLLRGKNQTVADKIWYDFER